MSVEVQVAISPSADPGEGQLSRWARAVMEHMGDDHGTTEVCIRLVGDDESEQLNANYRGQNKPTNVLSFPAQVELPDSDLKILGDIVICDPVVQREAQTQAKRPADHYAHMVVHGMLHLYGFDHIEAADAELMEGIEREILGRLGIADPYGPGESTL